MLEYANNTAQSIADNIDITDHEVTTGDGTAIRARWYSSPTSDSSAAVLYLHGGGMIVGSVPIFDGPVSRYVASTGVPMLDDRTTTPDPYIAPFAGWGYEDNVTGWRALLGDRAGGPDVEPAAAPAA